MRGVARHWASLIGLASALCVRSALAAEPSATPADDATASKPSLSVTGNFRMRLESANDFSLGRGKVPAGPDPFSAYPAHDVGQADMRLRVAPELALSDEVRLFAVFDAFDRTLAGSTTTGLYGTTPLGLFGSAVQRDDSAARAIVARRIWAEIAKGKVLALRFGRMPNHWGLGLVYNAGGGLDDDFESEVDRVELAAHLGRWHPTLSYDFVSEGLVRPNSPSGLPLDATNGDDVREAALSLAYRLPPEARALALERGLAVLEFGVRHGFRWQKRRVDDTANGLEQTAIDARTYTPDLFVELRARRLRVALESALVLGSVHSPGDAQSHADYGIAELGAALQSELRLLGDRLGLSFDSGFASGDRNVSGLSSDSDFVGQSGGQRVTTFRFHPNYRVDLILWRSLMQQVTGAYYFRPGLSYELNRDDFGQAIGGSLHAVYSRAAIASQAPGNAHDLGLELDAALYWKSSDGPRWLDGFYARLESGILFPMAGLGYSELDPARPRGFEPHVATALRLLLAVVY